MKQCTSLDKINKSLIDSDFIIGIRNIINPLLLMLSKTNIKYKIVKDNSYEISKSKPTIYVVNHYSAQDTPIICNSIKRRAYILAGKQNLRKIDEIFFNLYGTIFVDRKNKEDMGYSKKAMELYLKKNQDLIIFPEATWNLSDELLMLNMKWGVIEVAQNTGARIIPVNLDYDTTDKKCYIYYGNSIEVPENCDKAKYITFLRDSMATVRWYRMEQKQSSCGNIDFNKLVNGEYSIEQERIVYEKRKGLCIDDLREDLMSVVKEYSKYDLDYEQSIIYKKEIRTEEVFESIKKLELKK